MKLARLMLISVLLAGCTPVSSSSLIPSKGSDNYEVQWRGVAGNKVYGSYVIASKNASTPMKIEKIAETIPYTIQFSAPKNSIISAGGATLKQGKVEIKILKNGSECGEVMMVGSGAMANKTCK